MKKILLPNSIALDPELPKGWTSVVVDVKQPIPAEHHDAAAIVLWGWSRAHLASAAADLPNLQLVQVLSAGVDSVVTANFRPGVAIASGVGLHNATVTEHTLALLLSLVRRLPECRDAQGRHEWDRALGGNQPLHPTDRLTTLLDARVTIWGFGSIGQTLAPILRDLGAEVTGVAQSAGTRAGFPVIASDEIGTILPRTDVLIGILPASETTQDAINAAVFAALPRHAFVINVGRGATLDQRALADALAAGEIGGAAIDVTTPEPLPADSFLWDAPNLLITPHSAGGRPVNPSARISHNLAALDAGQPILQRAV